MNMSGVENIGNISPTMKHTSVLLETIPAGKLVLPDVKLDRTDHEFS